jgi:hypothetical protein
MVDILRKYPVSATDGGVALRQLADGLRLDATLADCNGSSYIDMKFTITPASARAVASEIARLQRLDVAPASENDARDAECTSEPLASLISRYALAVLIVLALPVTLAVLGLMP